MKLSARILTLLLATAASALALADPVTRPAVGADALITLIDMGVHHRPTGIEGNGLLGIEGNGIIQRFDNGELVLNDTVFDIGPGKVNVVVDASGAQLASVLPGHVVTIGARPGQGAANATLARVEIDHLLRGPIATSGIDLEANTITVLGTTLSVEDFTQIAGATGDLEIDDLNDGDYLRISGWLNDTGAVIVTRIERRPVALTSLEVSGVAANVDLATSTLRIGNQLVDFAVAQFVDMSVSELANGDRLEVVSDLPLNGGVLEATWIRRAPLPVSAQEGQVTELQNFVIGQPANDALSLGGQPVQIDAGTVFERGTVNDLDSGRLIEAEGVIDSNGVLLASRVKFDEEILDSEIRIFATVTDTDPATQEVSILGLTAVATVATQFYPGGPMPITQFSDITQGAFVEIRGFDEPDGSFQLAASRIRSRSPDDSSLIARVSSNDGVAIAVFGLPVVPAPGAVFEDSNGDNISEAQFIALAQPDVLVEVVATLNGGSLLASKLTIEEL